MLMSTFMPCDWHFNHAHSLCVWQIENAHKVSARLDQKDEDLDENEDEQGNVKDVLFARQTSVISASLNTKFLVPTLLLVLSSIDIRISVPISLSFGYPIVPAVVERFTSCTISTSTFLHLFLLLLINIALAFAALTTFSASSFIMHSTIFHCVTQCAT